MKRFAIIMAAGFAMFLSSNVAQAGWGSLHYGGWQPWWNIFAHRNRHLSPEERRLQRFWHDYYNALKRYYDLLDNIDWVAYYKNHGYQINSGGGYGGCGPNGGPQRIQFAPVFVSPSMQWAVPNGALEGAPSRPHGPPAGAWGGHYGMPPMHQQGMQPVGYYPGQHPGVQPVGYPGMQMPQQGGYPMPQMGGYPMQQMGGYPMQQMGGYPMPQMGGYQMPQQQQNPLPQPPRQ